MKFNSQHLITVILLIGAVTLFCFGKDEIGGTFLGLSVVHFIITHMG